MADNLPSALYNPPDVGHMIMGQAQKTDRKSYLTQASLKKAVEEDLFRVIKNISNKSSLGDRKFYSLACSILRQMLPASATAHMVAADYNWCLLESIKLIDSKAISMHTKMWQKTESKSPMLNFASYFTCA